MVFIKIRLCDYLGNIKYKTDKAYKKPQVGIVRGLAWTSVGGETLEIEVNAMPGSDDLRLTGNMGDVMKESAMIAYSYVRAITESGKEGVRIYPESLEPKKEEAAPAAVAAPQGAIPEGTVLGDGHIKIGLTRIDTRLLHGQVATTWTKMVNPDRIIVVSDAVSKDDLRKRMIIEAAPPGVKAHVIPIWKMIEVSKDPRFGETKAMLLFETPQDVLKAIEGGVDIKEVNLGSLAHSTGKVVVTKAVAMGKEDVETFEKLIDKGVTFNVRKVPSDSPENMGEMLKKAKAELK